MSSKIDLFLSWSMIACNGVPSNVHKNYLSQEISPMPCWLGVFFSSFSPFKVRIKSIDRPIKSYIV